MNEVNINCVIKITIQRNSDVQSHENFPTGKILLKVRKLTNGKTNFSAMV